MFSIQILRRSVACALLSGLALSAGAQTVQVDAPWTRATVPGQQAGGAFMTLTASQDMQLVGGSSSAAGVTEVHEMTMQGDVMRMHAIDSLALPAGQAVELKPGGYHLMLLQLKQPLTEGTEVPLTLHLRNAQGEASELSLQVPVRALTAAPQTGHSKGHHH